MLRRTYAVPSPYHTRTFLELFGLVSLAVLPLLALAYYGDRRKLRRLMEEEIDRQSAAIWEADDAA